MARIRQEQRALSRRAQAPAGHQRRYEASPADSTTAHITLSAMAHAEDASGYIAGVTAIIVPPLRDHQ